MSIKRVTAEVPKDLHDKAKVEAARRGVTLSEIVRDALRAFVGQKPRKDKPMDDAKK